MENVLMKYKNDHGLTYRKLARKVNTRLRNNSEIVTVSHESIENYAKGQNLPRNDEVSGAIADLLGITIKELLDDIKACKKGA